jgi:hypothetical protein
MRVLNDKQHALMVMLGCIAFLIAGIVCCLTGNNPFIIIGAIVIIVSITLICVFGRCLKKRIF